MILVNVEQFNSRCSNSSLCCWYKWWKIKDIIKVVASGDNNLALTKDGEVYSWGENDYGQLGNGTSASKAYSAYAIKVKDVTGKGVLTDISDIGTASTVSYALTSSGEVYSWGYNGRGELGIGNTTNQSLPKKVAIENVAKILGTSFSAVALLETGEIYTWGYNGFYQLGDGTTTNRTSPVQAKFDADTYITDAIDIGTSAHSVYYINKIIKLMDGDNIIMDN